MSMVALEGRPVLTALYSSILYDSTRNRRMWKSRLKLVYDRPRCEHLMLPVVQPPIHGY